MVPQKEVEEKQVTSSFFFNYVGRAASWTRNILVKLTGPQSRNFMKCMKAKFHCRVSNTLILVPNYERQSPKTPSHSTPLKPIQIPDITIGNAKIREEF